MFLNLFPYKAKKRKRKRKKDGQWNKEERKEKKAVNGRKIKEKETKRKKEKKIVTGPAASVQLRTDMDLESKETVEGLGVI